MYFFTKFISPILFLTFSLTVLGQTTSASKDPIDKQYESCIGTNQTTQGMIECAQIAEKAWDGELNKNYKQLMTLLAPDEKELLKKAQISWLAYRDNENKFSGTMYYNMQGSMWLITAADRTRSIVKARAIELKMYYEILKDK
ncbi:hypothetical protein WSM22_14900 [Cytophagales bacterium WSM2-2]|nr:hypothetical protein WSM22_14900 [Cytophagales bacterium WSM2-2]